MQQFQISALVNFMILFLAAILVLLWNQGLDDFVNCPMELTSDDRFIDQQSNGTLTMFEKYVKNRTVGREQQIPYNIFQTNQNDMIPWKMKYAVSSILEKNPQYSYRFFNGTERRNFMAKHMGKTVLEIYDKLIPKAYKADLFRYSVVYVYGGCYVDIAEVMLDGFNGVLRPQTTFLSTLDGFKGSYYLNVGFFCSVAGHQILRNTINLIIKSIAHESYGSGALDVTGPKKLADGFKEYINNFNDLQARVYNNSLMILRQEMTPRCVSFVIPEENGDILVSSRYPDYYQNMEYYIVSKNHYSGFYGSHTIYDKEIKVVLPDNYSIPLITQMKPFQDDFRIPVEFRDKQG